tara:strand:+ start:22871 stop:24424 length:1554 start_codon:yes stop_codon:yes gene_type:complete
MSNLVTVHPVGNATHPAITITDSGNAEKYFIPAPLIGWSSNTKRQGSTKLADETNVTLSFFSIAGTGTAQERAEDLISSVAAIEKVFANAKTLKLKTAANKTEPDLSWSILDPSVSVDESTFSQVTTLNVSFLGVYKEYDSVKFTKNGTDYYANLESFSDNLSLEPDASLGFSHDDPTGMPYRFTRTISATLRPQNAGNLFKDKFNQSGIEFAKRFVDARESHYAVGNDYHATHLGLKHAAGGSSPQNIFNLTRSETSDLSNLSYSVTIQGIYCDGGSVQPEGAFETYNTSVSKNADSAVVSVSIDGTLQGYIANSGDTTYKQVNSSASNAAFDKLNAISNNGNYGYGSVIFKRAQNAAGIPLNGTPQSFSVADSTVSNASISYNVSYDNRRNPSISGAITESIQVSDTYPTDVYASIEVMGKRDGPVFQYMNTTTHFERDVSIEVQMDPHFIPASTNGGELMSYSPSMNSNQRMQLNQLINSLSPYGANYVMLKSSNESWSPTDGRYSASIGWVYQ